MATAQFLDPQWRRTVLALIFGAAGPVLCGFAIALVARIDRGDWPTTLAATRLQLLGGALYATLGLLAIVVAGLAMTVALRQVSARFLGADFAASGGDAARAGGDAA